MSHVDDGVLNALLDGELTEAEAAAARAHLEACAECHGRFEEARRFLAEAGELIGLLVTPGAEAPRSQPAAAAPPPVEAGARRVSKTAKEAAIELDAGTQKSPAARPLFPAGERRVTATAKEKAIDAPVTAQSPAITASSPAITAQAPAIPGVLPLKRRRFTVERMAWAASIVLALGLGYFSNEIRLARRSSDTREGAALALADSSPAGSRPADGRGDIAAAPAARASEGRRAQRSTGLTAPARQPKPPSADEAADAAIRGAQGRQPAEQPTAGVGIERAEEQQAPATQRRPAPTRPSQLGAAAPSPAAGAPATRDEPVSSRARPTGDLAGGRPLVAPPRFRRVAWDEAITSLSGSIRLIDGLTPLRVEIGPGSLVPGSDPTRDVVRVVYADPAGHSLTLDQQPGDARPGAPETVNGLMRGDTLTTSTSGGGIRIRWVDRKSFWLSLTGSMEMDSLRGMVERIR